MRPTVIDVQPLAESEVEQTGPLTDALALFRRRMWWILLLAICGLLIGFAVFIYKPREYYSVATLELMGINEAFMNLGVVDPQAGTGNYSATAINMATQLRILESATLRAAVLERLDRELAPMADPQPDVFTRFRDKLGLNPNDPLTALKEGIAKASFSLKVRTLPGTRIIALECVSTNPEVASSFVNTLASEYMSQGMQSRTTSAQKTTQWIGGQVEETRARLEQAERRLQEFVLKSGNMYVAEQEPLATSKLRQLQNELSAIQSDRIAKQTRYETAMKSPPDSLPESLDDGTIRATQQQIATLRREMAGLSTIYAPQHDKVKRVAIQIKDLEESLQKDREAMIRKIKGEYEQALSRERLLSAAYSAQTSTVSSQSSKATEYAMLKREVETLRLSFNQMLQQGNMASIASAAPTSNVRVIDAARSAQNPTQPVLPAHLLYGFGGGAALGFGLFFLVEKIGQHRRNKMVSRPGHTTSLMRVQELGVVPSVPALSEDGTGWKGRIRSLAPANRGGDERPDVVLAGWRDRTSILAESFRFIITSIKFMNFGGRQIQTMVITSPLPGEGKTTVASNLAAAMAEAGRRVLLIDGDLRRPRVHKMFGLPEGDGFFDLLNLSHNPGFHEIAPLIRETDAVGVSVLTAGNAEVEEISRMLNSARLHEVLQQLRKHFSFILVDCPPLNQFSDARLIGEHCDGAVLVVRAGVTERSVAMAAKDRLAQDGVRLIGTILNDWTPDDRESRYSKYYNYYQKDQH